MNIQNEKQKIVNAIAFLQSLNKNIELIEEDKEELEELQEHTMDLKHHIKKLQEVYDAIESLHLN